MLYLQMFAGGLMFYLPYLCIVMSNTYRVVFLFCVSSSYAPYVASFPGLFLRLMHPMLPVSLDYFFVLCTLCCQFPWIISSSYAPYVVSFPGLFLRLMHPMLPVSLDCFFVLCTLCCQFPWIINYFLFVF